MSRVRWTPRSLRRRDRPRWVRKDFAPSEAVAVGRTIEALEKPPAQARQRSQGPRGKEGGRGKKKNPLDNSSKGFSQAESNRTTNKAAKMVGMSRIPYERAKAVVEAAEEDPETFAPLVDEMVQGDTRPTSRRRPWAVHGGRR